MKNVFISYARSDEAVAREFVNRLGQSGISGWMDAADISAGTAFAGSVRSALRRASAVVLFVSPKSLESKWVNFEIGASLSLGIPLIPIIIGDVGVEHGLPEPLTDVEFVDARNRPIADVVNEVKSMLREP